MLEREKALFCEDKDKREIPAEGALTYQNFAWGVRSFSP